MTCDVCGAAVPDAARWCGGCGAPTGPPPPPSAPGGPLGTAPPVVPAGPVVLLPVDDPPEKNAAATSAWGSSRRRRVLAVAVVAALAVLLLARADAPAQDSLLGRLDVTSGTTSTGAPGILEAVRWEREVATAPGTTAVDGPLAARAGDRVALRSGRVLADDGRVVRTGATGVVTADGLEAVLDGEELVLLDAVTGTVVERLAIGLGGEEPVLLGTADGGVLVRTSTDVGLVDRDGTVRWRLPTRAVPGARVVADGWLVTNLEPGGRRRLVDAAAGEVLSAPLPTGGRLPVVVPSAVGGDVAVAVVVADDELVAVGLPSGRPRWTETLPDLGVRLVPNDDAVVALLVAGDTPSAASPVETALALFDPGSGEPRAVLPGPLQDATRLPEEGTWDADARGVAVVRFGRLSLVAWDRRASDERVALDDVREVRLLGDRVVVRHGEGPAARVSLVDRADRSVLASVPAWGDPVARLLAHVDGHVVVGTPGQPVDAQAVVRVEDGADLAPVALSAALGLDGARLLGTGPDGAPLVATMLRDDRVTLVGPDGRGREQRFPPSGEVAATLPRAVGLAADRLLLVTRGTTGVRTLLLDRSGDGRGTAVDGVEALRVVDRRVLGLDADGGLVVLDPATGAVRGPAGGGLRGPVARAVGSSAVTAHDHSVAVGASAGRTRLVGVATADAAVVWSTPLVSPVTVGPVALGDLVVHAAADGSLVATRVADGAREWRRQVGAEGHPTALTAAGDVLVVGTLEGTVLVVDAAGERLDGLDLGVRPVDDVAVVGTDVLALLGGTLHAAGTLDGVLPADDVVDLP